MSIVHTVLGVVPGHVVGGMIEGWIKGEEQKRGTQPEKRGLTSSHLQLENESKWCTHFNKNEKRGHKEKLTWKDGE